MQDIYPAHGRKIGSKRPLLQQLSHVGDDVTIGILYAGERTKSARDHSVKGNLSWQF